MAGHVNLDRFLLARELPRAERTTPIAHQRLALGGTAANLARVAAHRGLRVGLVSAAGPDFPSEFRRLLSADGIDLRGFRRVPSGSSSTCFIVEDGRGGQLTLIDQGPLADGRGYSFDARALRRAAWAHLTTGPVDAVLEAASAVRGATRVAVDPAQEIHYRWDRDGLRKLLEPAEILFGNRSELRRAADLLGLASLGRLVDRVPLVVGTFGRAGARAWSRRGVEALSARRPRRIVQVTGAGDAFRGGFYSGWIRGQPLRACLREGIQSATRWIEGGGSLGRRSSPGRSGSAA